LDAARRGQWRRVLEGGGPRRTSLARWPG